MSENENMIRGEAVEAAKAAIWDLPITSIEFEWQRDMVTHAALEAAAPHIRAEVLEAVAAELDGADRVARERDGYTATINLLNAATYLRRRAVTERQAK